MWVDLPAGGSWKLSKMMCASYLEGGGRPNLIERIGFWSDAVEAGGTVRIDWEEASRRVVTYFAIEAAAGCLQGYAGKVINREMSKAGYTGKLRVDFNLDIADLNRGTHEVRTDGRLILAKHQREDEES